MTARFSVALLLTVLMHSPVGADPSLANKQQGIRINSYYDLIWYQVRSSWVLPEGVKATESLLTVVVI